MSAKRNEILNAAVNFLHHSDPAKLRVAEIARKANVDNKLVHYHFNDKNQLIFEAFETIVMRSLNKFLPQHEENQLEGLIRALAATCYDHQTTLNRCFIYFSNVKHRLIESKGMHFVSIDNAMAELLLAHTNVVKSKTQALNLVMTIVSSFLLPGLISVHVPQIFQTKFDSDEDCECQIQLWLKLLSPT